MEHLQFCDRLVYRISSEGKEESVYEALPEGTAILFAGSEESMLFHRISMRYGSTNKVTCWNPLEDTTTSAKPMKDLMKRYAAIEACKASSVIGVVLGTTSLADSSAMHLRLLKLIRDSGRKAFSFCVGGLSVPKLGNFPEVEAFVYVSCPENFLWDASDYPVPILTPFDLEIALGAREWTTEYELGLSELLQHEPLPMDGDENEHVQTLDGRMVHFEKGGTDIVAFCDMLQRYDGRGFRGLEEDPEAKPMLAIDGQHGTASYYAGEPVAK